MVMVASRRLVILAAIAVAAVYLLAVCFLYFKQRSLLFPAPENVRQPMLPGSSTLKLVGAEGTISVLYVPAPPGGRTVVHFHGNAEQLADLVPLAQAYQSAGLGFYAPEYPGYGLDQAGETSESSIVAAAEVALRHLEEQLHVSPAQTILEGQSIGTGVAVQMAAKGYGARLVLFSAYTSIPDIAVSAFPWLPVRLLVRDRFDSASRAPGISVPVLMFHGTHDEVIPAALGKKLAGMFPNATLRLLPGAGHNDALDQPGVMDQATRFAREP
jgi:pimeloyl-ACP methyl ester carboxylesterase